MQIGKKPWLENFKWKEPVGDLRVYVRLLTKYFVQKEVLGT
jgi:hypothetical protein